VRHRPALPPLFLNVAPQEIDCDAVGNSALRSKILKDKFLRDKEDVKDPLTKEIGTTLLTPATSGTTLAKIQARMTSSKLLAAQIATSVEALKVILDPSRRVQTLAEEPPSPERSTKKAKASGEAPRTDDDPGKAKKKSKRAMEDGSDDEGSVADVEDDGDWESGNIGGEEADADGWESGSIDNEGPDRGSDDESSESHVGDPREDDGSPSSNESDGEDSEDDVHRKSGKATTSKSSSKAESTFLPSLSVGYMLGDSDASDVEREAKVSDPRKNRRGQRARRAWVLSHGCLVASLMSHLSGSGRRSTDVAQITKRKRLNNMLLRWKLRKHARPPDRPNRGRTRCSRTKMLGPGVRLRLTLVGQDAPRLESRLQSRSGRKRSPYIHPGRRKRNSRKRRALALSRARERKSSFHRNKYLWNI